MGIGHGIHEQLVMNRGSMLNKNFTTYRIPTVLEMPDIEKMRAVSVGSPHPDGPYGAKSLGEMTMVPIFAALGNAVWDAVEIRITDAPITMEKVFASIKKLSIG